jgi:uncharacterized protein (DUF885 family)
MWKRFALAAAMVITGCAPARRQPFHELAREFVYTSLANSPVAATAAGYHRHGAVQLDAVLDDYSPASIDRQRRWYQELKVRLAHSAEDRQLSADDRADYEIIRHDIALALLELDEIQSYKHDPTLYIEMIGNALYTPFTLAYASLDVRYGHIVSRMERIPELLAQARANLTDAPEMWTRVAVEENEGNVALIDRTLRTAAPPALRPRYDAAASRALGAIREFSEFLKAELSRRTRDWRLGERSYGRKFRYALGTDRTPEQVLADAEQATAAAVAEMTRTAADYLNLNNIPVPAAPRQAVTAALDRIAQRHATPETYFSEARRDLADAREFVRKSGLLTLPTRDNLQVIETPEFMRGIYAVGGFNSAPALEPHLGAFYWLTPIPAEWSKDRVESKLREYNYWGLQLLTIHEAMPGHYVQAEYANDIQPPLRRVLRAQFGNMPYVEGWAVYATELMIGHGYPDRSMELRMTWLKQVLRVTTNAILDIRLHTRGMTDEQAMDLMIDRAFQEREEAEAKLRRAKLSSAQLPTYFVGWRDWQRLRDVYASVNQPFDAREFHDRALRAGAVPVPVLSKLLTGKTL